MHMHAGTNTVDAEMLITVSDIESSSATKYAAKVLVTVYALT